MVRHLEESLQRDSDSIRALVRRMGGYAERALRDCLRALQKRDRLLAHGLILRDQKIDQLEREIDQVCLQFVVRHQPAARHLRFAYAAIRINLELERVGDYAESIAKQVLKVADLRLGVPSAFFAEIASMSVAMLHDAVTAFVEQNAGLARTTIAVEEQVDTLRNQINHHLLELLHAKDIPADALTPLMTIARRFERVSDQAKSICQETLYVCTGEYTRHQGAGHYRILFVDHSGDTSLAAQSIARSMARKEFVFESAALAPQPLPPATLTFLKGLDVDVTQAMAKPLPVNAEIASYHLVVALDEPAREALPGSVPKTQIMDWAVPPLHAVASPEAAPSESPHTVAYLKTQISNLVSAILGDESS